jgi:hypothetical protein
MQLVVLIIAGGALLSALSYLLASKEEKKALAYSSEKQWFVLIMLGVSVWAFPHILFYGFKVFEWLKGLL